MSNNDNTVDLLQIKIEAAKAKLPVETTNAIAAIDWKAAILSLREKKGYSFEQLGDLETETELVLCGLTPPEEYPKELQNRMRLSKADTDELVREMNRLVFEKIKAELIKNTERKKIFEDKVEKETMSQPTMRTEPARVDINKKDTTVLTTAGINIVKPPQESTVRPLEKREEILKKIENPEPAPAQNSILGQKLAGSFQIPAVKTEHVMDNITKEPKKEEKKPDYEDSTKTGYKVDPYRMLPE